MKLTKEVLRSLVVEEISNLLGEQEEQQPGQAQKPTRGQTAVARGQKAAGVRSHQTNIFQDVNKLYDNILSYVNGLVAQATEEGVKQEQAEAAMNRAITYLYNKKAGLGGQTRAGVE